MATPVCKVLLVVFFFQSEPVDSVVYTVFASDPDEGSSGNVHFILTDPVRKRC